MNIICIYLRMAYIRRGLVNKPNHILMTVLEQVYYA